MAKFSKKVLRLLADELTYTSLREIDVLFENNDIPLGPDQLDESDASQRRERMRRYLASLDLTIPEHHRRLVAVFSDLMQDIGRQQDVPGFNATYMQRWMQTLRADGFEVDPWSYAVSDPAEPRRLGLTQQALAVLSDPAAVLDHLVRLGDTVESDPRLAVSTAKALIESTAKLVLKARGIAYTRKDDVTKLVARARQSLALAPKGASSEAPALRQLLRSLVTLAQSVAELRNLVGVGHGAEGVPGWVRPRHARLVVGAAQVWCQLMLETLGDPEAPWRNTDAGEAVSILRG